MKYIIEFEDEPCCDKPKLYRMKHTYTVCVPSETLEKFPKYEESPAKMSKNDEKRLKDLENLEKGDVIIACAGKVVRRALVIFVWAGEEDPYEIVTNYGVVMRRSAETLFELGYEKAITAYTTEAFFSESMIKKEEKDEDEELSNLQPGDIIYKYDSEGKLIRRIVNFAYMCPAGYELITECGWKGRYSLESLIEQGWHKLKDELTTKDFYWRLRGGET